MAEKKYSALALLEILINYSDEDHILSAKEIQTHLINEYGLDLERRTIYSNMDILEQNGYSISRYEDNKKGYYLEDRKFEKSEILLLCNAIHSSNYISNNQSKELITKLLANLSKYQRKEYLDKVFMPNPKKTPNKELLFNIEMISEAIRDKKAIEFEYLSYNTNKELVAKLDKNTNEVKKYIVEPRYIVYSDARTYMIVTSKRHTGFGHYRLDRIKNIKIINEMVASLPKEKDAYEYARNKLFMYNGEMIKVTFKCHNRIIDQMLDIFGTNIMIILHKDNSFSFTIETSTQGAKLLAQQYLDAIEIVEPKDLRKEFIKELEERVKEYKKK